MITNINFDSEEKKAGNKAAAALRSALRAQIKSDFQSRSGAMERSNVTARFKEGNLDRLVMHSPHYSFTEHFGSSLTGTQKQTVRSGSTVRSFQRHIKGETSFVQAHTRSGGNVKAFRKNIHYKAKNHIAEALKSTEALNALATELGNNRIVLITSQIDF
jgi:ABC-type lipoprotein release transport system permease subunit